MDLKSKIFGHKSSSVPDSRVGAQFGGGVVVFVDKSGKHGLVAAKSDMPGCSAGIAALTDLSEGLFNWEDAVVFCKKLETNGYRDWVLPSNEQLNLIFLHKRAVGGFVHTVGNYWSSSESNDGRVWVKDFSHFGAQNRENKDAYHRVRAVRAF